MDVSQWFQLIGISRLTVQCVCVWGGAPLNSHLILHGSNEYNGRHYEKVFKLLHSIEVLVSALYTWL